MSKKPKQKTQLLEPTQAATPEPGELKSDCVDKVENFRTNLLSKKIAKEEPAAAQAVPSTDLESAAQAEEADSSYGIVKKGASVLGNLFKIGFQKALPTANLASAALARAAGPPSKAPSRGGRKKIK